jgi:phage terminase small subunit
LALNDRQIAFVNEYLMCWNATRAALNAGYSQRSAYSQGHDLLKHPEIRAAIDARISENVMSADEALMRLSDQARASMEDFIDPDTKRVDLRRAAQRGKLHLVKKLTRTMTPSGENVSVELHDPQAALSHILKELHLRAGEPTDRNEVSGALTITALSKLSEAELDNLIGE